jgi:hypothetical protein
MSSAVVDRAIPQVPGAWAARDIGSPTPTGSSAYDESSQIFTVNAGGADIWGTSDKFRFVYRPLIGDGEIIARVDSITQADQWSKAGVMIRSSLTPGAAHALAIVSAGKGVAFQRRTKDGGPSTNTAGPVSTAPRWVRLMRVGTHVMAYTSSTGSSWTEIGSDIIALGRSA